MSTEDVYSIDELLVSFGETMSTDKDRVVYGVTDRSKESFWTRLNDFFTDRRKVPLKEKAYFFHLLAVMLDAGVPMIQCLHILSEKTLHPRFRRVISTMAHYVEGGRPLSDAMSKFPAVFEDAEIGVVKSGEAIGRLDQMLIKLSDQIERSYNVHLKVRGAMTYPIVVIVVLILATTIVMTMVVPRLQTFFEQSGVELPLLTRVVVGLSSFVSVFWWLFAIGFLLLFVMGSAYRSTTAGRLKTDYWLLNLPVMGALFKRSLISKFVRLLGVLAASGLPINKALRILGESMGNSLYEKKVQEVVIAVERGEKISDNLATTPFLFPTTVTQMLSIGEGSATLDQACEKLANHYDVEIEHSIKNMTTVLEPTLIVFVGFVVAVMALAILGPVFSLAELVG